MMSRLVLYTKPGCGHLGGLPVPAYSQSEESRCIPNKEHGLWVLKSMNFALEACIELEACSCAEKWTGTAEEACDSFL